MTSISQQSPTPASHEQRATPVANSRRTRRALLWALSLLLLLLVDYKVFRIGQAGWHAYQSGSDLQQRMQAGLTLDQLSAFRVALKNLASALTDVEVELRPLRFLFHSLAWTPRYGSMLTAIPELFIAGRELTTLASEGLALLNQDQVTHKPGELTPTLITKLATAKPQVASLLRHAQTAQSALLAVPAANLPAGLGKRIAQVEAGLPLLIAALRTAPSLPALVGMNGPRTYLVLVQNNHELRATGGFISAVGKVTLANAQLRDLQFKDSYFYWRADLSYPPAPEPMQRHMNIPLMLLRDANWSPDFPTTAQLVKGLYAQETGDTVAGVVTIDLHAAQLIVAAFGALQIPGIPTPVTGENFIEQVKQLWAKPPGVTDTVELAGSQWWKQRKGFMPLLAQAALQRLQTGGVPYAALFQGVNAALAERSIQVWVNDPLAAQQLADLGWDGSLHPQANADFLAFVDTNMGYNKVNAVVQRGLTYAVAWPNGPTEPAVATVTMTYTHPINLPNYVCDASPDYGEDYNFLIKRCYFDYVRLYVPAGSELLSAEGVEADSVAVRRGEKNTQVFAGYFVLHTGQSHRVSFKYKLPARFIPQNYALFVQRQAGTDPLPLKITIDGHSRSTSLVGASLQWRP